MNKMVIPSAFSQAHIDAFYDYIGFPTALRQHQPLQDPAKDIHFLTQLHVYMIAAVPYDNLWLHYNPTHRVDITALGNFDKVVTQARGRGSYCMGNHVLLNHILRFLQYPVYLGPARTRPRIDSVPTGEFPGWIHLVNIITLSDGQVWTMDVGFGGDGPTKPMPLVHDRPQVNLGSQEVRLIRDWIPTQLHRTEASKLWIYEYRNGKEKPWNSFYAFSETEAMEADFHVINHFTGTSPDSHHTVTQLLVKFLRREKQDGSGDQEIYGKRMLVNATVKENLGGKTKIVEECSTETDRVRVLKDWFGITLTQDEVQAITDTPTEIK
jgi:arylamine N-acetyltransferase